MTTTPAQQEAPKEPEKWQHFAPATPEPRPETRWTRTGWRVWSVLRHEWFIAAVLSLIAAMAWDQRPLRSPTTTLPQDLGDPALTTWQLAWAGHIVKTDPAQIWQSNAFYPDRYSFAFTDSMLGYLPFGLFGHGQGAAILRFNLVFLVAVWLSVFGAYVLVRQLGGGRTGAAVAAAAWAFAPWRLSQVGHLHVMSMGGMALALAMLARGHGWSLRPGYQPEKAKPGWALAGWTVAAWQMTIGFGIGLPFVYVLGGIVLISVVNWLRRGRPGIGRPLLLMNIAGGSLFGGACLFMGLPMLKVISLYPYARRTSADLGAYSPPLKGFFIAPYTSWLWGDAHESARATLHWAPEMTMLPGFTLYGLALLGLFYSIWTVRQRVILGLATVAVIWLAMGTTTPGGGKYGYLLLFNYLPGFDSLRTPGRLIIWVTLVLAILAAGAVSEFVTRLTEYFASRVPVRPWPWLRLATFIPLALVLLEGANTVPAPTVPRAPAAIANATGPILVLPTGQVYDERVMLWSTEKFPPMVNGGSGFTPRNQQAVRDLSVNFPSFDTIDYLRGIGIHQVIVVKADVTNTPWAAALTADVAGLPVARTEDAQTVVFTLTQ